MAGCRRRCYTDEKIDDTQAFYTYTLQAVPDEGDAQAFSGEIRLEKQEDGWKVTSLS